MIKEPGIFIEQYGIPTRMLDYAKTVFAKNRSLILERKLTGDFMNNKDDNKMPKNLKRIAADDFLLIPLLYSYNVDSDSFRSANIIRYVKIYHPSEYEKTHTLFALKCNDRNLEPKIRLDEIMVIHPQNTGELGDYVLYNGPLGTLVGRMCTRKGVNGISFKDNASEWHPGRGEDQVIYGKVISVMREL